ncbi:hypothetical protein CLOSTMETH_00058 [[Clostridium] methylpentosum DSM 5476]|uniref:Uncharacterized protein n=1 Tax=[Clostridium] methylpentosum DSM 5476 TaxID=537013 RepID=C0E886_9FIRM|nr:hypothetical protein CLOSTMETH_00058 [[Clostridium] methylpentosum DSM 5476]
MDDDVFALVLQRIPYLGGIVFFLQRAGRAVDNALAAAHAGDVAEFSVKGAADVGVKSAVVDADDAGCLGGAGADTAPAENTFVVVAHEVVGRGIELDARICAVKTMLDFHAVLPAEDLQLALAAARTAQASPVVVGEDELESGAAGFLHLEAVGGDLQPFRNGVNTGRNKAARALYFDHADAASADLVDLFEVAEGGNVEARLPCCLQNGIIFRHGNRHAVNFHIDSFHHFSPTLLQSR